MTTLKDVAKLAKVSKGAVSRVLNGGESVIAISGETKKRIHAAAAKLNYKPNVNARRLATGRRENIGVVYQAYNFFTSNPMVTNLSGAVEAADRLGYCISMGAKTESGNSPIKIIHDRTVDGVIVFAPVDQVVIENLKTEQIPFVIVNPAMSFPMDAVCCDDESGALQAMKYLLSLGHSRIAHITVESNHLSISSRKGAYEKVMAENRLEPAIVKLEDTVPLEKSFRGLLKSYDPTALFIYHDAAAWDLYFQCSQMKIRIPGDLSIIGVNDAKPSPLLIPTLTTVGIPFFEMGAMAVEMLDRKIKTGVAQASYTFKEKLIVRGSCSAPEKG